MTTIAPQSEEMLSRESETVAPVKDMTAGQDEFLTKIFGEYEFNRYGIYAILLIIVGCLAGSAVGLGAMESGFQIAVLIGFTMASLCSILAVAPMKYVLYLSLTSMAVSTIFIIINLIA
jgi:hypothetical protein